MKNLHKSGTWWVYALVSVCTERWTIIKECVKIVWNYVQMLHWQAWAAGVSDVIHQTPSEYKIGGILKGASDDSVATSAERVFCINRSVLSMNSKKKPAWFCVKGCFSGVPCTCHVMLRAGNVEGTWRPHSQVSLKCSTWFSWLLGG